MEIDNNAFLRTMIRAIDDRKGQDIQILDIHAQTGIADYFVICSGGSKPQTQAIAEYVEECIKADFDEQVLRREGVDTATWILLDYGHVIVQIFQPDDRAYYNLEKLWGDSPRIAVAPFLED